MDSFSPYGIEHVLSVLSMLTIGMLWIYSGKRLNEAWQPLWGFGFSLLLPTLIIYDLTSIFLTGKFNLQTDLPLHICRILPFVVPFVLYFKNRAAFGVLYYLIFGGTLQAILTPDLQDPFPTYEFWRYWLLHVGLINTAAYMIFVYGFVPTMRDLWRAVIAAQGYLVMTLVINLTLGSNYGYTMEKPPVNSVADFLGPWPWYILSGELLMGALFLMLYLPFGIISYYQTGISSRHG